MPKKKLTPSLKEKIKKDYHRLNQSDFEGEALTYLKRVRGARKARIAQEKKRAEREEKVKGAIPKAEITKGKDIRVGDKVYSPGEKVYDIIVLSAKNKGQSVKAFVKEHQVALEKLLSDYLMFAKTEVDKLREIIKLLDDDKKIFSPIRTKVISKRTASFNLHMVKKTLMEMCGIYPVVFIEYAFDLDSNLHFNCPRPGDYKEFEDCSELKEFLEDEYPKITFIEHDNPS